MARHIDIVVAEITPDELRRLLSGRKRTATFDEIVGVSDPDILAKYEDSRPEIGAELPVQMSDGTIHTTTLVNTKLVARQEILKLIALNTVPAANIIRREKNDGDDYMWISEVSDPDVSLLGR